MSLLMTKKWSYLNRLVLITAILCLVISLSAQFAGGQGTQDDPYQVETATHLNNVRNHLSSHFIQTADIDLDVDPYNTGDGWVPIGTDTAATRFSGTYNGNGFVIDNLFINRPTVMRQALFAITEGATLINIGLTNVNLSGQQYSGPLLGYGRTTTTIRNCYSTGIVNGFNTSTGGLIGYLWQSTTVDNCYSTVDIVGNNYVGGLIGMVHQPNIFIRNSYATGNVRGNIDIGGLVGRFNNSVIENCYSTGVVIGNDRVGGLNGFSGGTVINSYWDMDTSGRDTSAGGTGRTTLEMLSRESYEEWDFEDQWMMIEGFSYPWLRVYGDTPQRQNIPGPRNLAGQAGNGRVLLSWEAPAVEAEPLGYNVYRDGETVNEELIPELQYLDEGITNWQNYSYFVTAVFEPGESMPSLTVVVSPVLFGGGSGTVDEPFLIENAEHLNGVRFAVSAHFIQTANIDLGVEPWNVEQGWLPIGSEGGIHTFRGLYNGNGFSISNLTINRPGGSNQGLFAVIDGAYLDSIRMINVNITSATNIGGLAGYHVNSVITNCSATGSITSTSQHNGGLVGYMTRTGVDTISKIIDSYSTVNLTTGNFSGGLIGFMLNSELTGSWASGNIRGGSNVGGLIGYTQTSVCLNSFATGDVTGTNTVGGLMGRNVTTVTTNCYSVGRVTCPTNVGGLIGVNSGEITNSFWDIGTSGHSLSAGGEGKSTAQMVTEETFREWDFENTWAIIEGERYPHLIWQQTPGFNHVPKPYGLVAGTDFHNRAIDLSWEVIGTPDRYLIYRNNNHATTINHPTRLWRDTNRERYITYTYEVAAVYIIDEVEYTTNRSVPVTGFLVTPFAGGDGSVEDPYQVSTVAHLDNIRYLLNLNYIQTANLDLDIEPWNDGEGWLPIGSDAVGNRFTGTFNGNGFRINNLFINRAAGNYQALFAYAQNATIQNIHLDNVRITGRQYVAALIGSQDDCKVINCSSSGTMTVATSLGGGLIGRIMIVNAENESLLLNCHSSVAVTGGSTVGGLVGQGNGGIIENCSATGNVSGSTSLGGLVATTSTNTTIRASFAKGNVTGVTFTVGGLVGQSSGSIANSFATGNVVGRRYAGGFLGRNWNGSVYNSFSTGRVSGDMIGDMGGFIGLSAGVVENSYWNTETSEQAFSSGGFGRTTNEMIYPYQQQERDTYLNWDFEDVWVHDVTRNINNGYPYLFHQTPELLDTPQVTVELTVIDDVNHIRLDWEAITDARSYRIYASPDYTADDWGAPISVVDGETTHFIERIGEAATRFYYVIASAEDPEL